MKGVEVRSEVDAKVVALKTAMEGSDAAVMRRVGEELQRALSRVGEHIYGEPSAAGVGDCARRASRPAFSRLPGARR